MTSTKDWLTIAVGFAFEIGVDVVSSLASVAKSIAILVRSLLSFAKLVIIEADGEVTGLVSVTKVLAGRRFFYQ